MLLVLLATLVTIEANTMPRPCNGVDACENKEESCGMNFEDVGFVLFTKETAKDHNFLDMDGKKYGICTIVETTTTTSSTSTATTAPSTPTTTTVSSTSTTTTASSASSVKTSALTPFPKLCSDSGICSAGQKCGINYDIGFVELNDETKSKFTFLHYQGRKFGLCIKPVVGKNSSTINGAISTATLPQTSRMAHNISNPFKRTTAATTEVPPSRILKLSFAVDTIDFNNQTTKNIFEQTFITEAGALDGSYTYDTYADIVVESSEELSESANVQVILLYDDKISAMSNSKKMSTQEFNKQLVTALQKQDSSAFADATISHIQVLKSTPAITANESDEEDGEIVLRYVLCPQRGHPSTHYHHQQTLPTKPTECTSLSRWCASPPLSFS